MSKLQLAGAVPGAPGLVAQAGIGGELAVQRAGGPHVLAVASAAYPIHVLGPGARVVLWTQGCGIGCAGCASRDTWDPAGGMRLGVEEMAERLRAHLVEPACTGLSISGGEPLDQADALVHLLDLLGPDLGESRDVLLFTGRSLRYFRSRHPQLMARLDAVVAGPYRQDQPSDLIWRSSGNQQLRPLSLLGRDRYGPFAQTRSHQRLQVVETDGNLTVVGLPRPGDLDQLTIRLAKQGVRLSNTTWARPGPLSE